MLSFLESNKDTSPYSAYKTKAVAKYFFRVKNVEDVSKIGEILSFAQEENLPILFLGSGTNCLFAFDEYRGIIIHNELLGYSIEEEDSGVFLRVSSGELVHPMVSRIYEQVQNTTLVPWSGLPGTFGGAIIWNAGCFKLETKDILEDAYCYFPKENVFRTLENKDFEYVYRSSKFKNTEDIFIVSARFNISKAFPENEYISEYTPESLRLLRKSKQPNGISCGSFFKNPPGFSAGALIDQAGLKGKKIGNIGISEQHGNFLTAEIGVKWQDVLALREYIVSTILEKFQIQLEEEVKIIRSN